MSDIINKNVWENQIMTGIICAMEVEAAGLVALMRDVVYADRLGYKFILGTLRDRQVCVVLSGIGKVNAAAVTTLLISDFGADEVINLGVCGGNVGVGTMIVATSVVQYDFDTTAFGDPLGQLDGFDSPYIACSRLGGRIEGDARGVIASGDRFVTDEEFKKFLSEKFGAIGFDMESGAVAQVCAKAKKDFVVVRVVSDGGSADDYEKFKLSAAEKGVKAVLQFLGER